ncbi:MAG: bile acid:sodium symporter family protein [Ferruginibacter sp.]|nr:bile acid:sodium symporter family protein [Cytophagales bacterium]
MNKLAVGYKILLGLSGLCLFVGVGLLALGVREGVGPWLAAFFALLALGVRGLAAWRGFSYTIWIFAAVVISMSYPGWFTEVGGFPLRRLIVPLLQLIMFGMGTSMGLGDFAGVIKTPKAVLVGVFCHFTIMPLMGYTLAKAFGFPPEIAAGVVLIGSMPCGLASNVMSYLANANLALSITLTAVSTLLAPFLTPFLMKVLAGQFIPVDAGAMMLDIIQMVIVPIVAGLVFNRLFHGRLKWLDTALPVVSMVSIALIITIITAAGRDSLLSIGAWLIVAALIHNGSGYFLGYWFSRLIRMDERSCRTVAIEVGMQNAGLASAIALQMGKVATVGLAPAVFGPLMNITGSSLATWWRGKPVAEAAVEKSGVRIPT